MGLRPTVAVLSQRSVLVFVGLVALTLGIALSQAPRADALVYWTTLNDDASYSWSIGVARLDGTGASNYFIDATDFDDGNASYLAVDLNHVYWGNDAWYVEGDGAGAIGRANLDGSGFDPAFVELRVPTDGDTFATPTELAAAGGYVYWTDLNRNSIGRATAGGGGVDYSFIDSANPGGIAVTDEYIYWRTCSIAFACNVGTEWIARASLDGSVIDREFLLADGNPYSDVPLDGLAVSSSHIYWSNNFPDDGGPPAIARATIDGGGVDETFIDLPASRYGEDLAVDDGHIYWADYNGGTIGRARLDGSAVDPNFITVSPNDESWSWMRPIDVAVDSRTQLPPLDGPPRVDGDQDCAKAKAKLKRAKEKLEKARRKLRKAKKSGTDARFAKAKKKAKRAKKRVNRAERAIIRACSVGPGS